jgi:hypothetical protein
MITTRPRRWRALALLAVVGALALASCGSDSDDSSSSGTGGEGEAATIRISGQDFSEQRRSPTSTASSWRPAASRSTCKTRSAPATSCTPP